ncbi:serine-repeat antigen 4 (SERA) [Plasmodium vivax]|uniref:Serine-repeat antigen 4 (SERA) n=3 Tax=Plasmodium vivax TaxID=5855 RepID=A5KBN1_PLAVS|nr:serine-repeat antigen 4 (SERA) [Plasmodium vivax]AAB41486.1 V-SERA 4 [Plasmodium vivax]EDL43281.1 serine-repeat antigen 4 (SERA) [Plasmodium vivax]|eukprot:XP_001613008.1 serine-repeat antigen 4 (SERA) [Plasmodium vivax Sal-1]
MKLALPFLFILSVALLDNAIKCDEEVTIPDPPQSPDENPGGKDDPPGDSDPLPGEGAGAVEPAGGETDSGVEEGPAEQAVDQPLTQSTDQPADQPAEQPADQALTQPTDQPANQPVDQPTDQPIDQPTDQPVDQTTDQTTEQPAGEPLTQSTDEPVDQPLTQSTDQPAGEPLTQSTDQPAGEPLTQSTDQPADQPADQSADQPVDQTTDQVTEQPTDQPTEQPTDQTTDQPTEQPTDEPLTQPTDEPLPQPIVEASDRAAAAAVKNPNEIEAKCAQLKDQDGVKITGPCGAKFQVFLIPHVTINVETETNAIHLGKKLDDVVITKKMHKGVGGKSPPLLQFEEDADSLLNQCTEGKTFKFVVVVKGEELILKWKVYEKVPSPSDNNKVDVRTFLLKNTDRPITAIQVHTAKGNEDSFLLESKEYILADDMPAQCDLIAANCFLSGSLDIEGCYKCALLSENAELSSPCFDYLSPDVKNDYEEIKRKAQQQGDLKEVQLAASIGKILQGVFKKGEAGLNELVTFDQADAALKEELLNYCALMKEVDASGVLDQYQLGSEEDIFANLTSILKNHAGETKSTLQNKLKNPAICLKNANEWMESKKGLLLPSLSYTNVEATLPENAPEKEDPPKGSQKIQTNGYDGIINFDSNEETNMQSTSFIDNMYCNDEYCDRWKDSSSCVAKIEVEDQGACSNSWLFASKVHLESMKCMNGHDHMATSALYVANCSGKEEKDKCHVASNPLEFLDILEETQFLPAESDLPYSYKAVNNVCPQPKSHWQNIWADVKLLDKQDDPNAVSAKGYAAYQSDHFKGNMDAFIKLVKSEVMKKGSVIAYVKADDQMSYDLNGKKVLSLCGSEEPNLAVNIVGYGNYISAEGVKKPYWLLRNSWGKHWGDDGTFKVDMHGPPGCQHNFIHTAAVFNLHIPPMENVEKKKPLLYNYYMKSSPDFYNHIFYRGVQTGEESEMGISGQEKVSISAVSANTSAADTLDGVDHSSVVVEGKEKNPAGEGESAQGVESPPEAEEQDEEEGDAESEEEGEDEPEEEGDGEQEEEGDDESEEVDEEAEEAGAEAEEGEEESEEGGVEAEEGDSEAANNDVDAAEPSQVAAPGASPGGEKPQTVAPPSASNPATPPSAAPAPTRNASLIKVKQITEVIHIMKHIKSGKLRFGIATYEDDLGIANNHDCLRSYSQDPEKLPECIQFCYDEWNNCKGAPSPGYCLNQRRRKNDCYFCFV